MILKIVEANLLLMIILQIILLGHQDAILVIENRADLVVIDQNQDLMSVLLDQLLVKIKLAVLIQNQEARAEASQVAKAESVVLFLRIVIILVANLLVTKVVKVAKNQPNQIIVN